MVLTAKEKALLKESINHSIAFRLANNTRKNEVAELRAIKTKLEGMREYK